jgi:pilus assembly protein CpaE
MIDERVVIPKDGSANDLRTSAMVFTRDGDAEGVIRRCLDNLSIPSAEYFNGGVDAAIAQLAKSASPRLLFVDVGGSDDPVMRIKDLAEVCEPGTGVIVIGDQNDIRLYRELKHAGIVEYYFKPLVSTLITQTAQGILTGSVEQTGSRTGRLVFILGVRGGVGATTIATSAVWQLAEVRQRRIVLLDLDLQSGDAALQLDSAPTHALREALEHPERVDDLFLERATIRVTERLSLMSSLENIGETMVPGEEAVLSLLGTLMHRYRNVFVDIPMNIAPRMLRVLHLPSVLLLVSKASLVSAREIARWREAIGPDSPERQTLHILNQYGADGSLPDAEFARAAGQAPDITIPYDRDICISSNLGIKGVEKCLTVQRGLASVFRHITGEALEKRQSFFGRLLHAR